MVGGSLQVYSQKLQIVGPCQIPLPAPIPLAGRQKQQAGIDLLWWLIQSSEQAGQALAAPEADRTAQPPASVTDQPTQPHSPPAQPQSPPAQPTPPLALTTQPPVQSQTQSPPVEPVHPTQPEILTSASSTPISQAEPRLAGPATAVYATAILRQLQDAGGVLTLAELADRLHSLRLPFNLGRIVGLVEQVCFL